MKSAPHIKPDIPPPLEALRAFLATEHRRGYLVGGALRDRLLGRAYADIDVAVSGEGLDTARAAAATLGGKFVKLDETNGVGRIILKSKDCSGDWQIDINGIPDNIAGDLTRRDFTINAMALDINDLAQASPTVIDPAGGLRDMEQGIIRHVSEDIFKDDAARLLRAVRLAAELNFTIAAETLELMRRDAACLDAAAGERLREELLRILAAPSARAWQYLDETGLITALCPEMADGRGIIQPPEHSFDVYRHSLETVGALDYILRRGEWALGRPEALALTGWSPELADYFATPVSHGSTRFQLLKLAALLHDIAKPRTRTVEANGKIRFLEHAERGAGIAADTCQRLRFSTAETDFIADAIRHHMRPNQMSQSGPPSRRAIYRFFRDAADCAVGILYLSLADHLAARGHNLDMVEWQRHAELVNHVLAEKTRQSVTVKPPRLIDGHDLMTAFHLNPGRQIGDILESVREAQAEGLLETKTEALDYVRRRLLSGPGPAAKQKYLIAL